MSKHLDSILKKVPSATASYEEVSRQEDAILKKIKIQEAIAKKVFTKNSTERIVAEVPKALKDEIRSFVRMNPGHTERSVLLAALKMAGFSVKEEWLIDNRSVR